MKERIQKVLANAGVESRRHIEEMVLQGRISVNGHIVTDLPVMVDPAKDRIEVDGEKIRLRASEIGPKHYIIMNKPRRVYTTNVAQGDQKLAIDLLPEGFPRVRHRAPKRPETYQLNQVNAASDIQMHTKEMLFCLVYLVLKHENVLQYLCHLGRVLNFNFAVL